MSDTDKEKIHIHIDAAEKRPELPEYDQLESCPKCGGEPETGFGLAGGGFGIYSYCPTCGVIISKSETHE
jgi:hypothetical protein